MPPKPIVQTYSPADAAALLGISKSTILAAIECGELPAIRFNKRVFRITAVDAAAWYALKGGRVRSTSPTSPATP